MPRIQYLAFFRVAAWADPRSRIMFMAFLGYAYVSGLQFGYGSIDAEETDAYFYPGITYTGGGKRQHFQSRGAKSERGTGGGERRPWDGMRRGQRECYI